MGPLNPSVAGPPPLVLCLGEALVDRLLPVGFDPAVADRNGASACTPEVGLVLPGEVISAAGRPSGCEDRLGGAPANVACGLARLGTPAAFAGRLGTDAIGAAFAALFAERGVDTTVLQWDPIRPSRIVLVRRDATGERSFGGFLGDRGAGFADQALDATDLRKAAAPLLAEARWLLTGTLVLASPAAAVALEGLLDSLPAAGSGEVDRHPDHRLALAVDLNWRPTFWGLASDSAPSAAIQARIRPLLERAALIKCAAEEARWFFGTEDPLAIGAALPGRPGVCITDGAAPLRWSLGGRSGQLEPLAIEAVDTTGAGDAFMAGLLHGLCQAGQGSGLGSDPEALVRFAAACGSLVCRGAGAIDPQPTSTEVECFLAQSSAAWLSPQGLKG
jgi:fructokinase